MFTNTPTPKTLRQHRRPANQIVMAILLIGAIAAPSVSAEKTTILPAENAFAAMIEDAHGLAAWQANKAVRAHVKVELGGKIMIQGTMLFDTPVGKSRIELDDGTVMVFDGQDAWVSPNDSPLEGARFHLLTWPYFLAAPMKLRDPGSHLAALGPMPQGGRELPTAKLTFDAGVGDSPDDWYIIYRHPDTQRLLAMAYIITYGVDKAEAEKEPHAITFDDYKTVDGVTLSTHWQFWHWDPKLGTRGEPIGHAKITNIQFVDPTPQDFQKPADAKMDAIPE